jgi:uncharacterized protein YbaR (Trm112 family)
MISPDFLAVLCCPFDPAHKASLIAHDDHLSCEQCGAKFKIKDGFPNLVPQEAELPPGCSTISQLPARHRTE